MSRIAVDAMGGDRAPNEIVLGAVAAAGRGIDVVLVGDERRIAPTLEASGVSIPVVHASEVVEMDDDPSRALREKKDSSISVAARLVASGDASGLVSAGSTGAAMAAAAFLIGRLSGISRPAIASLMPVGKVILDSGANVSVRPEHLAQFAVMGAALSSSHFGKSSPRVGLLNIGEEDGKGRDLEKAAALLITDLPGMRFIGNVEGTDIATDRADVIVTDGFTGNVLLKTAEGAARTVQQMLLEEIAGHEEYQAAVAQLAPALMAFRNRLDPESVGGAYLLGIDGVVVIAHGSSSRVAATNAIAAAAEGAAAGLPAMIERGLTAAIRV